MLVVGVCGDSGGVKGKGENGFKMGKSHWRVVVLVVFVVGGYALNNVLSKTVHVLLLLNHCYLLKLSSQLIAYFVLQ